MDENIQKQLGLVWAKSNRTNPQEIHLLLFHMLESAAVALALWECSLAASVKSDIAELLQLSEDEAGRQLAYWVGLHDIGKASPIFQSKLEKNSSWLTAMRDAGLPIDGDTQNFYHSKISAKFINKNQIAPREVEVAISGHHGTWDASYPMMMNSKRIYGDTSWENFRIKLFSILKNTITPYGCAELQGNTIDKNEFVAWFSGFICVSDWIASDESQFPYSNQYQNPDSYYQGALKQAKRSLDQLGWIGWQAEGEQLTFQQMYIKKNYSPNHIQHQVIDAFEQYKPKKPFVMVVEAPTGIGKTEIALYIADRWLQSSSGSGLYIAMPTQATSNQLYGRTIEILGYRYPNTKIDLILAHGQAEFNEQLDNIRVKHIGEPDEITQGVFAADWFQNNRKRTLLAPFGVGTVDQVLLSILQTRHFFIRLFGLKNKVIIFDEVHAYDTYMNVLFHRLLEWLRQLGVSVIILSATLPESTREEIVANYGGVEDEADANDYYPRLTIASTDKQSVVTKLDWNEKDRTVQLNWVDELAVSELLKERLSEGGCAAVICNTVRQAQETYQAIQSAGIVEDENLILFHARFPIVWRNEIEKEVLNKFGKNSTIDNAKRPQKAVVVATQVIEQSLDIDFDFMVSALAPVDLVLQRVGRLHRHERTRPQTLKEPELAIIDIKKDADDIPLVGIRDPFYSKSILLKTYLGLRNRSQVPIIKSTKSLIDVVYSKEADSDVYSEPVLAKLQMWEEEEYNRNQLTQDKAGFSLVGAPDDPNFSYVTNQQLIEEEENNAEYVKLQAKTRDGDLGIQCICLFLNEAEEVFFEPEFITPLCSLSEKELKKRLMQNRINIADQGLLRAVTLDAVDSKNLSLPIKPQKCLIFKGGVLQLGKYQLTLSRKLGLQYHDGGNNGEV